MIKNSIEGVASLLFDRSRANKSLTLIKKIYPLEDKFQNFMGQKKKTRPIMDVFFI